MNRKKTATPMPPQLATPTRTAPVLQVAAPATQPAAKPAVAAIPEKSRASAPTISEQAKPAATRSGSGHDGNKQVTIEAKIDVGFGNKLYLRGEGHGLSWNQGVPLTCVDSSTWKWSGEADDKLKFKLLLNDCVWSKGEDLVAAPGQKVEVAPAF